MDDLLDLNWTSGSAIQPAAASSKPGSRAQSPATYSAFDSLASAGSSYAPNYTSSYSGQSSQPQRPNSSLSPAPTARTPSPNPSFNAAPSRSSTRDAFDSLFDDGSSSSTSKKAQEKSMTLQDRMQMQSSGLGFSQPINAGSQQKTSSDPWDFDMLSASSAPQPAVQPKPKPINRTSSPFDAFDELDTVTHTTSNISLGSKANSTSPTVSSSTMDDDILGLLGQPVSAAKPAPSIVAPRPTRRTPTDKSSPSVGSSRPPSRPTAARTPSPPPHILGQVVGMGFSVQQARLALAATLGSEQPGQWNVNAAMEILASDGAAHAARERQEPRPARTPFDNGDEEDDEAYLRRQQRNQRPQRQDDYRNGFSERHPREKDKPQNEQLSDNTASDLLQQASVFGSSMLKSANAYWKTSRAQLQKAIEEKKLAIPTVSGPSSGRSTPNSGRPKWMTEETKFDDEAQQSSRRIGKQSSEAGFKDFDHEENLDSSESVLAVHPSDRQSNKSQQRQTEHVSVPSLRVDQVPRSRLDGPSREDPPRSAILLGATTGEKKMYTSPNRRKTAASAPVTAVPPPMSGTTAPKPKPSRPPRPHISATPAQLVNSQKHRIAGNEHFKLGQYGEAVSAYSSALNGLPDQHIARVAVLNNRANARLKIGEERQAAEDATSVLDILSAPTELSKVTREVWEVILHDFAVNSPQDQGSKGDKLDAHDALGKALSRRARGYEGCEKWRLAMLDWQMITELGDPAVVKSAGGMRVVSEGLSRCKKAVDGANRKPSSAQSAAKRPSPAVSAKPPARTKPFKSEAVDKLRVSNQKAEQEEAESLKVKDSVDAKITEWKAGKETNLRALIASLDNVLWEDLGWKKVGMHELISDSQLKIKYVRAISKVHPDKIKPDVPVEHRLIANAVFSTLSDAWNAHNG